MPGRKPALAGLPSSPAPVWGASTSPMTLRDDLPLMPSLSDFFVQSEELSRTIFTIIQDDLVQRIVMATEEIVGDLEKPGNGILIVLPTDSVHGFIEYGKPAPG